MSRANWISIRPILILAALLIGATVLVSAEVNSEPTLDTQLRRPVELTAQPSYPLVGNRPCGTITMLDTSSGGVVAEHSVANRIADMAELPNAVQVFDLKEVLTGETEQIASGWLNAQGGIGGATVDSSGVVTGSDNLMAVPSPVWVKLWFEIAVTKKGSLFTRERRQWLLVAINSTSPIAFTIPYRSSTMLAETTRLRS